MIISGKQVQSLLKTYGKDLNSGVSQVKDMKNKTVARDDLAISNESKIKQRVLQTIRQSDDIRKDKVDELAEQISAGTYTHSDDEVAEKMISRAVVDTLV